MKSEMAIRGRLPKFPKSGRINYEDLGDLGNRPRIVIWFSKALG